MIGYFLITFLILLCILILLQRNNRGESPKRESESTVFAFEKFTQFSIPIPLLDGILIFYQARKYGVSAVHDWMKRVGDDSIVKVSLGPFSLVFSKSPKLSHKLLGSSDPGHLSRPLHIYHRVFGDFLSKGLFGTDSEEWLKQRKVLSRAFTFRTFQHYVKIMNKYSKKLTQDLIQICEETGSPANGSGLYSTIHLNTLKITVEFLLGADFIETNEALEFSKHVLRFKEIIGHRLLNAELYFPPFWWIHPMRWELRKRFKEMNIFIAMFVDHYRSKSESAVPSQNQSYDKNENDQRCLIEEMIKQNATSEEIYYEIGTIFVAGFDTAYVTLKLMLQHLACHPEYQILCRQEVDNLLGPKDSESDTERNLTINDLSKLEYLERFINECLRMTPTVPVLLRQLNTPLELEKNTTLPQGTIVAISPFVIHHNPKYYPNPEIFNPDRFLPEEVEKREPGAFIPFSAGMRNCIGKRFAMLEMKTLLTWILRNFEVYSEDRMQDVKLCFEISIVPERDYRIKLKRRNFSFQT